MGAVVVGVYLLSVAPGGCIKSFWGVDMSENNSNLQSISAWDGRRGTDVGLQSLISASELLDEVSSFEQVASDPFELPAIPSQSADQSNVPFGKRQFERKVPTDVFACIPRQKQDRRVIATASRRPPGMTVDRYWLEQLTTRTQETFWLHLPTDGRQTIDLLFDRGIFWFAPNMNGQLFLDAAFRKTVPRFAQRLIAKMSHRMGKPAERCLFEAHDIGRFNATEHRAMAQLCFRIIRRSAQMYGDVLDLRCTFVESVERRRPLVFSIDELLASHLYNLPNTSSNELYQQISEYANQLWLFRREQTLGFDDVLVGSTTRFGPLQKMMSTVDGLRSMSHQPAKVWLGLADDMVQGVIFQSQRIIAFSTPPSRIGFILYSVKPLLEGINSTTL